MEDTIDATQEFVSVGVNRVAHALDWGGDGVVAYGGHHAVVLYDPKVRGGGRWRGRPAPR
jgi:elongator complex protein 2